DMPAYDPADRAPPDGFDDSDD
ncbi:MAG: hypothetical protein JWO31_2533, partial [Phycisphaerales bacterium]|nr:hypothetical protein [Phycisphaerales bacterium]